MNEGRTHNEFTIAKLASIAGLPRAGELERYFSGEEEPTFAFIDHFSSVFGVNRQWLKFGEWTPYYLSEETHPLEATDYYERIVSLNPAHIFFVQDTSTCRESGIILKLADWKYHTLPRYWRISSEVGGTGRHQIYCFYKLIVKLKNDGFYGRCGGRRLAPQQFSRLFGGQVFPGALIGRPMTESNWWDAFTDIIHEYPIATRYRELYGEEFVAAQMIVLESCKQRGEQPSRTL
jgi:hypothetical protein